MPTNTITMPTPPEGITPAHIASLEHPGSQDKQKKLQKKIRRAARDVIGYRNAKGPNRGDSHIYDTETANKICEHCGLKWRFH